MCVLESSFDCRTRDLGGRRGPGGSEEVMSKGSGREEKVGRQKTNKLPPDSNHSKS